MKSTLIVILFFCAGIISAQNFKVEKVIGNVKAQIGASENWSQIKPGEILIANSTISTSEKSSVSLD